MARVFRRRPLLSAAVPARQPLVPRYKWPDLARVMRYFGWRSVRVVERNTPKHDIAIDPRDPVNPTVYVGPKWRRRGQPMKAFAHEGLHTAGLDHDSYGHAHGYYAHNREKDRLTDAVWEDIQNGSTEFDPDRFALDRRRLHETRARRSQWAPPEPPPREVSQYAIGIQRGRYV